MSATLDQAVAALRGGGLAILPTETVYGLAADAGDAEAVAAIFAAKGRPRFNPLICHYATIEAAFAHVLATQLAERLAHAFWPGPLTLVLPRRPDCPVDPLASAGLDTMAIRVPAHPIACALIAAAGRPIAAPSANRSGGVSPTIAAHVVADLEGKIGAILDCGPTAIGLESTVLDLSAGAPTLLRPGGVPVEAIEALLGPVALGSTETTKTFRAPGMLASHYAPTLPLRPYARAARADEALLAFGPAPPAPLVWNLSETADLTEAAARLFSGLRWLDAAAIDAGLAGIAAMPVPDHGIGRAINDRLMRAAAPRS